MAIPFRPEEAQPNRISQMLCVERLLKELLVLLRWATATGRPIPPRYFEYFAEQLQQQRRFQRLNLMNAPEQPRNDSYLPDLVTSTGPVAQQYAADDAVAPEFEEEAAARPAPHYSAAAIAAFASAARAPAAETAAAGSNAAAGGSVAGPAVRPRTVTLQVEMCPECYHDGSGRKLKVIGVTRVEKTTGGVADAARADHHSHHGHGASVQLLHEDDAELVQQIRVACRNASQPLSSSDDRSQLDDDHQQADQTRAGYGSKVAKHLVSLLNPSAIETSILTAVFVVVGWKIFIKQ